MKKEQEKTKNQLAFGDHATNATKICTECGKKTSIIKSIHREHLWLYWGFCDHCGASQIKYKDNEEGSRYE